MGAWDCGPFDNDDALDCVGDLQDADPAEIPGRLAALMSGILDTDDYLECPQVNEALAAAVLVAARLGADAAHPSAVELLASRPFTVDERLRSLALRTLDRAGDAKDNEWYGLWADADDVDLALNSLLPFRRALESAAPA